MRRRSKLSRLVTAVLSDRIFGSSDCFLLNVSSCRISVAALLALAQKQVVRESRSALLPTLNGNFAAVDAEVDRLAHERVRERSAPDVQLPGDDTGAIWDVSTAPVGA